MLLPSAHCYVCNLLWTISTPSGERFVHIATFFLCGQYFVLMHPFFSDSGDLPRFSPCQRLPFAIFDVLHLVPVLCVHNSHVFHDIASGRIPLCVSVCLLFDFYHTFPGLMCLGYFLAFVCLFLCLIHVRYGTSGLVGG